MGRIDKESYYLDIAETVLERSTCSRSHSGALIVRNDEIVSTGYNGAPRGRSNCIDLGYCIRERLGIPAGERYELCRSVHAEMNAIISAARSECIGGTIYLAGRDVATGELIPDLLPCPMCRRMIINAGLSKIVGGVQSIGSGHSIPWRETTVRSMKLIALPEDSIRANRPITEEPSLSVQANRHGYSRMSTSYRHACNAGGRSPKVSFSVPAASYRDLSTVGI